MKQRKQKKVRLTRQRRLSSAAVASVLLCTAAGYLAVVSADVSLTGSPLKEAYVIIGIANLGCYLFVRLFSGLAIRAQIYLLSTIVAAQLFLVSLVRVDGLYGNGRPILAFRFSPRSSDGFGPSGFTSGGSRVDLESVSDQDFPAFRGRDRSGIVNGTSLMDWKARPPHLLWRRKVGAGWSSFAVSGHAAVTMEQRGPLEMVVCYDLRTGEECWAHGNQAFFREFSGGDGPRATPVIHDERVYALGATGILDCLDGTTGKLRWSVNVLDDNGIENRLFGMTGSPLVLGDSVIVSPGGVESALVAYSVSDGNRRWRAGNAEAGYSSPQPAHFAFGDQILNFSGDGLLAHDTEKGTVLWQYPWMITAATKNNVFQPIPLPANGPAGDRVLISSGYGMGCALLEINQRDDGFEVIERWRNKNLRSKFASGVADNGYVYGLDEGILTCIDLESGARQWRNGRFGHGQLVLVGGWLLIQAENGDVAMVRASPENFDEVARLPVFSRRTWNHPVVSGKYLLLRNDREAACYELAINSGLSP